MRKNKKNKKFAAWGEAVRRKLVGPVSYKIFTTVLAISFILSSGLVINAMLAEEGAIDSPPAPPAVNNQICQGDNCIPPNGNVPPPAGKEPPCTPENPCTNMPQPGTAGGGAMTVPMDRPGQPNGQPGQMNQPGQPPMNPPQGQMNQPGQPEPMNQGKQMNPQGQQGQMMQQGPSEEEQQKMNQQRLEGMKKGLNNFIKEMIRIKKNIVSYEKKGVAIPEELKTAIAKIDEVSEKIKTINDADELQDMMEDFQDSMNIIRDWMPKLPRLAQMPKLIKQADKEIIKADKAYLADKKKVDKAKLDMGSVLADFRAAINEQKNLLAEVKGLMKTDPEEAMDKLTEDFFGSMDNMWENERTIQMGLNLKKGMIQMAKENKEAEKTISKLKKNKIDTAELEALLPSVKSSFEEVKTLAAAKPLDFDAVMEALDNLMAVKQEFMDAVQELTGENGYQPQLAPLQNFKVNVPQGFDFGGGSANQQPMMPQINKQPITDRPVSSPTCNVNGVEIPGSCENYPQ